MPTRASRAVLFLALLLAFHPGCRGGGRQTGSVSVGTEPDSGANRGTGGAAPAVRSPRPDGGPILPAADQEIPLAFGAPAMRVRVELPANPNVLDVQLSIDTTASIGAEIDELQNTLEKTVVPQLRDRVADVSFGVSKFADFPAPPFGWPGDASEPADRPFVLLAPITSDVAAVASAVARLDQPLADGGDVPEAGAEALYQIATGQGYDLGRDTLIAPYDHRARAGGGTIGGVGFREGALRVVLHVTDARSHAPEDYAGVFPGTHSLEDAGNALRKIEAKVVAIVSGACSDAKMHGCNPEAHTQARAQLEAIARMTGGVGAKPVKGSCPTGVSGAALPSTGDDCPLVYDVDATGHGLSDTAVGAIAGLVDGIRFDAVTGDVTEDPVGFVKGVVPVALGGGADAGASHTADLVPEGKPDGVLDSFVEVHAREMLAFDITLENDRIRASDVDQVFRAQIEIRGDTIVLLRRTLRIRVPKGDSLAPLNDDAGR